MEDKRKATQLARYGELHSVRLGRPMEIRLKGGVLEANLQIAQEDRVYSLCRENPMSGRSPPKSSFAMQPLSSFATNKLGSRRSGVSSKKLIDLHPFRGYDFAYTFK